MDELKSFFLFYFEGDILMGKKFDSSYLPDLSSSKHGDEGYYNIMAFQESGKTYTADQLKNAGVEFDMMLCLDGTGYAHF